MEQSKQVGARRWSGLKLIGCCLLLPYVLRLGNAFLGPYLNKADDPRYLFEHPGQQLTPPGPFAPIASETRYTRVELGKVEPISFSSKGDIIFKPKNQKSFFLRDSLGKVAELTHKRFPQFTSDGELMDIDFGSGDKMLKVTSGPSNVFIWENPALKQDAQIWNAPYPRTMDLPIIDSNSRGSVVPCLCDGRRITRVIDGKLVSSNLNFPGETPLYSVPRFFKMFDARDLRIDPASLRLRLDGSLIALTSGTFGAYLRWPRDSYLSSIKGDQVTLLPPPPGLKINYAEMPIVIGNSVVVHCYVNFYQRARPFLYVSGEWKALPLPQGAVAGRLVGINSRGDFALSATMGYKKVGFLQMPIHQSFIFHDEKFERIEGNPSFGSAGTVLDCYGNSMRSNIGNFLSEDGAVLQTDAKLILDAKGNVTDRIPKTAIYVPQGQQ